jgi:hypothetical protein
MALIVFVGPAKTRPNSLTYSLLESFLLDATFATQAQICGKSWIF